MIKDLKNNFLQVSFLGMIWIVFLITIFNLHEEIVPFLYIWNLIGISILMGIVFGIAYPYLWNYSTFKVTTKIIISTFLNFFCGIESVYLFSPKVFEFVKPYLLLILLITLIGHIIGFYFFSKYENKKIAESLNKALKN
ncbi:hypothetical protein J6TS1_27670 [Siminovitchia terrae]|uniref:Uncharacterized protein n=1 Tax=Siminovitchia terrae TaxID=1914933 RepID=A0ABQ4KYY7_SIMTE|nr:hypothetical protein [Siminovitchia terrae]GIN96897.1 hypothetical protein J6TS1_27670 [Siminovitchia terrae]